MGGGRVCLCLVTPSLLFTSWRWSLISDSCNVYWSSLSIFVTLLFSLSLFPHWRMKPPLWSVAFNNFYLSFMPQGAFASKMGNSNRKEMILFISSMCCYTWEGKNESCLHLQKKKKKIEESKSMHISTRDN